MQICLNLNRMKKFLLITSLLILLFNSRIIAQVAAPSRAEMKQFMHDMTADSTDSWSYSGGNLYGKYGPKFNVWVKSHATDSLHHFISATGSLNWASVQLYNSEELELASTSITPANASRYQYRVVAGNGTELQPWTTPSVFKSNKFTMYAYFGKFNNIQQTITLTIAEKSNMANASVYVYNNNEVPVVKISKVFVQYNSGLSAMGASEWNKGFAIMHIKDVESINLSIANTWINELYHVYIKREFDGETSVLSIGNNWEHTMGSTDPEMHINNAWFTKPGKYTIIIRPEIKGGNGNGTVTTIGLQATAHFTVLPGPISLPLKTVELIILIIVATGGYVFVNYRSHKKRQLAKAAQNKQIATLQLQAVRSQLNPHFIFNALAGIQNLMNKNEIENANKYLARFARLTRNVLDDGNKELTSIEKETELLNDYLLMEQTRFGFKFTVETDATVDRQTEIPAMLLQPFVENAVKHGVSALKENGMVTVNMAKKDSSLILSVKDNGNGFSSESTSGMGMKLCEERINLLNSIYKNTHITLHRKSDNSGTLIEIELRGWV
jgi:two-component system LytT family sensor kinase